MPADVPHPDLRKHGLPNSADRPFGPHVVSTPYDSLSRSERRGCAAKGSQKRFQVSRVHDRYAARLQQIESLRTQIELAVGHIQSFRSKLLFTVRGEFLHSISGNPPIARISAPRGVNVQLYLLLLMEAQSRSQGGQPASSQLPLVAGPRDVSWTNLVVSPAKANLNAAVRISEQGNRARQVRSAFIRLEQEGLVRIESGRRRSTFRASLLHESGMKGTTHPYIIPYPFESALHLPRSFYTQGWIYLLTPSEIRMYMALRHLSQRLPLKHAEEGVYCAGFERVNAYAISRDVYESHLTLSKFGLIQNMDNPLRHRDGKYVRAQEKLAAGKALPAHRFKVCPDTALFDPAFQRVRRGLKSLLP